MPRIKENVKTVKIARDAVGCYATIERACLAAITACLSLQDQEHADKFSKLKAWAAGNYQEKVDEHFSDSPALG